MQAERQIRRTTRIAALVSAVALVTACKPLAGKPAPDLPLPAEPVVVAPAPSTAPPETTTTVEPTTTTAPTETTSAPTSASGTVAPSTTPRAPATKPPAGGGGAAAPAAGAIPAPGSVGFRGDRSQLKVIDGPGNTPPGTQWNEGALRFGGGDVTLDGVYVKGGIEYSGRGTLTIRNSVIEGNRRSWAPLMGVSGHIAVSDSTLSYKDTQWPGPQWGNGVIHGDAKMTLLRNDISGAPDGIQIGGGDSLIEQNHIHDLVLAGSPPNNTHNDGIQNYGGANLVIRNNRIDISANGLAYDGAHQNAAIFIMPSTNWPSKNLQVVNNYLGGGGFILRLGAPMSGAVVTGNQFGPTTGGWGEVLVDNGGIAQWSDNLKASGQVLPKP